ncbi:Clp protease adapter protein ClpF, chloroplastic [Sesamum angolense]|uniref:Clp protease adapter protein ClpF, chloroplastic n=1 Tax=Sesamum angolense TaxID=2727404 RepID=A0AAE1X1I7_9LAMI|nr:Clp protease adapter protein ClpF, chloroplastic [Sesamum angolense]
MVQSMSINTLVTSRCSVVCGSNDEWRRNFGQVKEPHILPGAGSLCLCSYSGRTTSFGGPCSISRPRSLRVQAGWLFKGSDKGSEFDASTEHSESANEDILMFFFELDLATRVQYALNLEQYDIAQQLRNKLTEVESEVIRLQESRRGSASKSEAQDMAISILRLRADLQNAVESENYSLAAELRDEISKLEAKSLAASVKAQAYENAQYAFRLGQKVKHKKFGYRAVICGMDPVCCESKTWMDRANVEKLTRGPDQPFYQDRFDHPYASFLFYGMDAAGDFIPIKQLREKYSQPRHELPYDPLDEEDGKDAFFAGPSDLRMSELVRGFLDALDETHIEVRVPDSDKGRYRNRKGQISVNVLGVCNMEGKFIYALSGWEGSAANGRVLRDAIHRPTGLKVPTGNYYLCDNRYNNVEGFLTSYCGVRYHLKEWGRGCGGPQTARELFNLRHGSARNIIE